MPDRAAVSLTLEFDEHPHFRSCTARETYDDGTSECLPLAGLSRDMLDLPGADAAFREFCKKLTVLMIQYAWPDIDADDIEMTDCPKGRTN